MQVTFIIRVQLTARYRRLKGQDCPLSRPPRRWSPGPYNNDTRVVELNSHTALWYHSGKPPVSIRWVLVRDPLGQFQSQALLCTDPAVAPTRIVEWFALRWR